MGALEKLFVGMQFAVLAGVVERNVSVSSFVAVVDFAHIERLGIDVDADSALLEFGEIQNLVNRFERIDISGMRRVHFVNVGGSEVAGVTALGKEEIFLERFGTDGVVQNVVLNSFQGEAAVGYRGEIFDPIGD